MLKLKFEVNPYYLLAHTLERAWDDKPFPKWRRIQKRLSSSFPTTILDGSRAFLKVNEKSDIKSLLESTERLFDHLVETDEFKRLIKETEDYRNWLESEWQKNRNKISHELADITGLKIPSKTITVFVTHPTLNNGWNMPESSVICWGHPEDWSNYSLVYLCHEILHILTHKEMIDGHLGHALIELATDNELRIRLNGYGKYFKEKSHEIGHPYLRGTERKIMPFWKKYLDGKTKAKDILELEKYILNKKGPHR